MTSERVVPPPWFVLAVMLAFATALALMPPRVASRMRSGVRTALEPAQSVVAGIVERSEAAAAIVRSTLSADQEIRTLHAEVSRLNQRQRRLEIERLADVEKTPVRQAGLRTSLPQENPLLLPHLISARLLGQDAALWLHQRRLLNLGYRDGIDLGALVTQSPDDLSEPTTRLLDQGGREGMQQAFAVLAGQAILGKIDEVGRYTSTVQLVRDARYRDAIRLAHRSDQGLRWGPAGVWEGTGSPLCRVTHVDAKQPVSVGDLVVSAAGGGILDHPLLYGFVEECTLAPASSQWEISVRPAAEPPRLGKVWVLLAEINPQRP